MDELKRRSLVDELAAAKNFEPSYSKDERRWFVGKLTHVFASRGLNDAQIEQQTRATVTASKTLVTAERDFTLALKADGNARFTARVLKVMRTHRVQILYGAIATEPKLAESGQIDYLRFLAKRRFRCVCRMYFWVNPNPQGYFRYPHKCAANQRWRVNEDAAPFWEELTPPRYSNFSPSLLETQADGKVDPVKSISKLFVKKPIACNGNLFDCSTTIDIVLMDSLLEAKDPDRFLRKLADSSPKYFLIQTIDDTVDAFFMNDTSSKGLVRRVAMPMPPKDLQVGDQCYIYNHALYKTFRPTGSWTGEFSFVYASGNRDYRSSKGFVFGGHGKQGTLFRFYHNFVAELSSYLAFGRRIAAAHLAFMRGGAAAIAPGTVNEIEHDVEVYNPVTDKFRPAAKHRLLEYDQAAVAARDFTKVPTKAKPKPKVFQPGFLIVHSKSEHVFYLAKVENPDEDKPLTANLRKRIADLAAPRRVRHPIKFRRIPEPLTAAIYGIENWGVAYVDRATSTETIWPFFEMHDGALRRKELKHKNEEGDQVLDPQLFDAPFSLFTSAGTDIEVNLPTVDFGAHRTFLSSNGAF